MRGTVIRFATLVATVLLGLVVAPHALAAPSPVCAGSPTVTCTFVYTDQASNGPYRWTVPAGVTSAIFNLSGAQGGGFQNLDPSGGLTSGTAKGGQGAHVVASRSVTPGQTLQVDVGRQGAPPNAATQDSAYGGGGQAGIKGASAPGLVGGTAGGGGGGASAVLNDGPLLVAAGGGGTGAQAFTGGGASGLGGQPSATGGGAPGTASAGGAGGPGSASPSNCSSHDDGLPGAAGSYRLGGTGGNGGQYGGGGGAGGYYGGGGGGGGWSGYLCGANNGYSAGAAGGGGGGSSYTGGGGAALTEGANAGDGSVTITYTVAVNTTSDHAPDPYPACSPSDCTLREAILDANSNLSPVLDTITFAIPGSGEHVIQPTSALPAISDAVLLDGSSQVDNNGLPLVRIDGSAAGAVPPGLQFSVPGTTSSLVNKLAFTNWRGFGLAIDSAPVTVHGSIFGTNDVSAPGLANDGGVNVANTSRIGGTGGPADRNYFVGGQTGIALQASAVVQGNWVGLAPDGSTVIGAAAQGIRVERSGATIGGTGSGDGNTITGNAVGVRLINTTTGNTIAGNAIYSNGGLGIGFGFGGIVANDPAPDADTGPNGLQNFPTVTTAMLANGSLQVRGTLVSAYSTRYAVDLYANGTCGPGNGEGAVYLGRLTADTDASGTASFSGSVGAPQGAQGQITATATAPDGSTSEFSTCRAATAADIAQAGPTLTVNSSDDHTDGTCGVNDCTLREAIDASNLAPAPTTIGFAVPTESKQIVISNLLGALPSIGHQTTIDGTTQPGIAVVGTTFVYDCLTLGPGASGSVIWGLVISGCNSGITLNDGAANVTIGGDASLGRGNRIYNFGSVGVGVAGAGTGNVIQGNVIGLDPNGGRNGGPVGVSVSAPGTVVGAAVGPEGLYILNPNFGNVIAGLVGEGPAVGIDVGSGARGTRITANSIGTDRAGTNASIGIRGVGIRVSYVSGVQIGPGNTVAYNSTAGVAVNASVDLSASADRIVANSIHDNPDGKGIVLTGGANDSLSAPALTSAASFASGATTVRGSVNGPVGTYFVELFKNGRCDASGQGEGETYVGFTSVSVTDGPALFTAQLAGISPGTVLTATLTNAAGSTSGFSSCLTSVLTAQIPASISATLTAASTTLEAGTAGVDIAKLPLSAIAPPASAPITQQPITQHPITQQPITQQPITQQPITQQPITQQPIAQQPISQFGFSSLATLTDPASPLGRALGGVTLDSLPTSFPGGWPAILAGTALAGLPEQHVAFRDVLTLSPLPVALRPDTPNAQQLQIGQLDFLNSKLSNLPLFALAFGNTSLLDINPVNISVATGTTKFPDGTDVPQLTAARDWATMLAGPPYNCTDATCLTGQTVLGAALAGAPITQQPITQQPITQQPITQQPITQQPITQQPITQQPIHLMPIAQMPLQAPITQQPITQQPITQQPFTYFANSASPITQQPITQQPFGQLPAALGTLPLVNILASGRSAPSCPAGGRLGTVSKLGTITIGSLTSSAPVIRPGATGTLADAYCAGALAPGATLQALANVADLSGYTLGDIAWYGDLKVIDLLVALGSDVEHYTFGDLVGMMINRLSIEWESLPTETLSQNGANPAGKTTFTAAFTLNGPENGLGDAKVTVTLPPFARYVPGTAKLDNDLLVAAPTVASIASGDVKRTTLSWSALPALGFNQAHQLSFDVYAGFVLGPQAADVKVSAADNTVTGTASRPITVVDTFGDAGGGNDTTATATVLPATSGVTAPGGEVIQSYIANAGDVDVFKIPNPGTGYRLSVHLTNLPADYDLSIAGPDQPALRTGTATGAPLQDPTVRDNGVGPENRNTSLEPAAVQDLPITQQPITQQPLDQSLNRGLNAEDAATLTSAGGDYFIRVAGYNGASNSRPYSLRVEVTPVAPEPVCTARTLPAGTAGSAPVGVPAGTNTIFVVNRQRLAQTYNETEAANVMSALSTIANGPAALGIKGIVLPVDSYSDVRAAYSIWDTNPCSPTKSNAVSTLVASKVDAIRSQSPTVKYVVIVGGFDQIPPFAVPDITRIANETGNASTFENNQYYGWAAAAKILTDDPYYTTAPVAANGSQVFVPDLVGGRLVETPSQIVSQLSQYATANGTLQRQTAFASGYDFVKDSALAADTAFRGISPLQVRTPLVNDTFTRTDLLGALFPAAGTASFNVINGHFDDYRTLTAGGNSSGTLDVVTTADVDARPDALLGRVLLTVGCHSGLSVTDAIVGISSPLRRDWADAFASQRALWGGNTGYGLGDTETIAYSEQLVVNMAKRLDGSLSIGEALTRAKADYFLQKGGNLGAYDRKAMAELTLYGLPFYGVGVAPTAILGAPSGLPAAGPVSGATNATTPAAGALVPDPVSGINSAAFTVTPNFGAGPTVTPRGKFYSNAGQVNALNYRPIVPQLSLAATRPGVVAHSPFIESLSSTDDQGFDPVYQTPVADQASVSPELTFGDAAFPSKLPSVVTTKINGANVSQLNITTGQFFIPDGSSAAVGSGVMRRFTTLSGRVFYDPSSVSDFEPPTILDTTATTDSSNVLVSVDVNDPATTRVFVLFNDGSSAQWKSIDLAKPSAASTRWTGGRPAASANVEYIVQACDGNGNCATSSNKAKYFKPSPPPAPVGGLTVALSGSAGPFTFTGPVTAAASGASSVASVSYSLDGGTATAGSSVTVTGEGLHTVRFVTSDGSSATKSFVIDTKAPTVQIQSPPAPDGTTYSIDAAPLASAYSCLDGGSGIASCTAQLDNSAFGVSGTVLPWTPGVHTLAVTATDGTGKLQAATRTYRVVYPFSGFNQPVDNPPTLNLINAGQAVPVKFSLGANRGLNILMAGSPVVSVVACAASATVDPVPDTLAATTSGLQYDGASNQYIYVWKTVKGSTGCRMLDVKLIDGTSHTALFKFK